LGFEPTQVADAAASWNSGAHPAGDSQVVMVASAQVPGVAASQPLPIQIASLQSPPASKRSRAHGGTVAVASTTPVSVTSYNVLVLPPIAPAADPAQTWRPPTTAVAVTAISAPISTTTAAPWSNGFAAASAH